MQKFLNLDKTFFEYFNTSGWFLSNKTNFISRKKNNANIEVKLQWNWLDTNIIFLNFLDWIFFLANFLSGKIDVMVLLLFNILYFICFLINPFIFGLFKLKNSISNFFVFEKFIYLAMDKSAPPSSEKL